MKLGGRKKQAASRFTPQFWLGSMIAALLAFGLGVQYASYQGGLVAALPDSAEITAAADFAASRDPGQIIVLLEGAVDRRGYYLIDEELSLRSLLEYAHLNRQADISQIDLAHEPEHGDAYYIKSSGEADRDWLVNSLKPEADDTGSVIETLININTATARELETLPGIGKVKAQAIIDYRVEHQGFRLKEELLGVKGIGVKLYEDLADRIQV